MSTVPAKTAPAKTAPAKSAPAKSVPAKSAITPRRALAVQAAIIALAICVAEFAPRPGLATLYLPLAPASRRPALDWALGHGSYIIGTGPAGGLLLGGAAPELAIRAAREGALAIAVPSFLCRQTES